MNDTGLDTTLAIGSEFVVDGERLTLTRYIDLASVLAVDADGVRKRVSVAKILEELTASKNDGEDIGTSSEFENLSEADWTVAQKRAALLVPLIGSERGTKADVRRVAAELQVDVSTVYRWMKSFRDSGKVADLAPKRPNGGRGKHRIDQLADAIVSELIDERYLTIQRPSVARLMRDIAMRCRRAGVPAPHPNTVRRRVAELSERKVTERRYGRKQAEDKFAPRPDRFPGADWPGAVWQIDHTPLDVVIVDDVHRRHIGRPWATIAIDVYSRCIAGFYLSLDPPSEVSVGMCLVHAMLPKEGWMAALGLPTSWPVYGVPATVHADNGKEFRGTMISRAAEQYRFRIEWRKVKTPNWGGHIERLMGTVNTEVHALPGTTFSNPIARGDYLPHKEAVLTLTELETYLADFICGVYHQQKHSAIARPPIRKYEAGLLGEGNTTGRGLPRPPSDAKRLRLDFMPFLERTVQPYGLRIDGITYYDPVLEPWIRASEPGRNKSRRVFMVRRDPRDISVVQFLDPDTKRYYPIPYRNLEHPPMSVWELREVRTQLRREGQSEVDESLIFETFDRLSKLVEQASDKTVRARKASQKKRTREHKSNMEAVQIGHSVQRKPQTTVDDDWEDEEVKPFSLLKVRA